MISQKIKTENKIKKPASDIQNQKGNTIIGTNYVQKLNKEEKIFFPIHFFSSLSPFLFSFRYTLKFVAPTK